MDNINVLIWYPFRETYINDIFKKVKNKYGIEYKDKSDFGFEPDYSSQLDFNRIIKLYYPDIIILYNITANNLLIDIPENIKVVTYCDHFYEQFALLGKQYFQHIPKNNYLYIPALDVDRIDRDNVLGDERIRNKLYFDPFVTALEKRELTKNAEDNEKFACDLSIVSSYSDISFLYWCYNINPSTFHGRILMPFLLEIIMLIRYKINEEGKICIEDNWLKKIIMEVFDKFVLYQYINDKEEFIKVWFCALKYNIIPHEYRNCVVDWLIERNYDIKIYGNGWDKNDKYKEYAFGELQEGSVDLCKAYQYSKINIGLNLSMGLHRRNIEVIENDCLCFQPYVDDSWMYSDYNHFFQDGKDIVIYRNKKELYDKIDFYLSHDYEREQLIKAGQSVVERYLRAEDIFGNAIKEIYGR